MDIQTVKEFDKLLDKYNVNGNRGALRVLSITFAAISLAACFIPVDELFADDFGENLLLLLYGVIFSAAAVLFHLNRMLTIGQGTKAQGVYSVLRYTPCLREMLIRTRINKLLVFVAHLLGTALCLRVGIDLATHSNYIPLGIIAVIIAYGFVPCVFGLLIIYTSLNYKKK